MFRVITLEYLTGGPFGVAAIVTDPSTSTNLTQHDILDMARYMGYARLTASVTLM